jgi:hypothetical protein
VEAAACNHIHHSSTVSTSGYFAAFGDYRAHDLQTRNATESASESRRNLQKNKTEMLNPTGLAYFAALSLHMKKGNKRFTLYKAPQI